MNDTGIQITADELDELEFKARVLERSVSARAKTKKAILRLADALRNLSVEIESDPESKFNKRLRCEYWEALNSIE